MQSALEKMSARVLDTMSSHIGTVRNRTLQTEKLTMNRAIDYLEPRVFILVPPFTARKNFVDSEGSACISGCFADEGHISC